MAATTTSAGSAWMSFGSALLQGWSNRYMQKQDQKVQQAQFAYSRKLTDLNNQLSIQQATLANKITAGQNRILQAQAHSENVLRQISNKRILQRTSLEHEQATENFLRTQESLVQGGLEDQIKAAEQRGAFAASAALSGTLGSTIDTMESTLKLKQNRQGEYLDRQGGYATYDQLKQMAGIVPGGISQLDSGRSIAMLDYGYQFAQVKPLGPEQMSQKPIAGNFFADAAAWAMGTDDGFRQIASSVNSWFTPKQNTTPWLDAGSQPTPSNWA